MKLLNNILLVIFAPGEGWKDINMAGIPTAKVLSQAFFPLLIVLAISAFMPIVYGEPTSIGKLALSAIVIASSFFFTYYITNYLLGGFFPELVKTKAGQGRMNDLILYSLIFYVLLFIIRHMLPIDFTPVKFLMAYVAYIVHKDIPYLGIEEKKVPKFEIIASLLMMLLPLLFIFIFDISFNLNYGII